MDEFDVVLNSVGCLFRAKAQGDQRYHHMLSSTKFSSGFPITDWASRDIAAAFRKEALVEPGDIVMITKCEIIEVNAFSGSERRILTDILYKDHVYHDEYFFIYEWLERFEKVDLDE